MLEGRDIKENPELKALSKHYIAKLFLTFNGSVQTYLAVTQEIGDKDEKLKAWDIYNEAFNEKILVPLLEVFDKNKCGVAEMCMAVLKLLEIAGTNVAEVDKEYKEEQDTLEFWHEKYPVVR